MIKLVISDVDGTLIYKNSHLNTARFPVMLDKLAGRSVTFAVATGRHYRELQKLFGVPVLSFPAICCDGAYTVIDGKPINATPISKNALRHFFDSFYGTQTALEFHSFSRTYILGASSLLYSKAKNRLSEVCRIDSYSDITDEIFYISVYGKTDKFIPHESVRLTYSSNGINEYANRNTSKAYAATLLAKEYDTSLDEVLFFGDGQNDRELILSSRISYTTYCADKKVFDLTCNHTRDVIGTVIRLCNENKI